MHVRCLNFATLHLVALIFPFDNIRESTVSFEDDGKLLICSSISCIKIDSFESSCIKSTTIASITLFGCFVI